MPTEWRLLRHDVADDLFTKSALSGLVDSPVALFRLSQQEQRDC